MQFCEPCMQLNISLSSFISHPGTDDNLRLRSPIYSLGRLDETQKRSQSCQLCRLVFAAFQSGPLKSTLNLTDMGRITIFAKWVNALGSSKEQRLQSSTLAILLWPESPHIPPATYKVVIRAVSGMLPDQPYFGFLSPLPSSFLNYDLIRTWLKHCKTNHTICSGVKTSSVALTTKHFWVIDVEHRCIIRAPENCQYIALSYVWGGVPQLELSEDNFEQLTQRQSLKEEYLTTTIRDAMELTRKLRERYLWVDALCIIQDSDEIRQQSIQDMGRIYADSLLTIVSATCVSANDPLHGVSKKRDWKQWYQKISPSLTLSAHFDFKDYLMCSTYSERAWTFQEFHLANRSLIFSSNGQVYFSCKEAVYSEEVVLGKHCEPDAAMFDGIQPLNMECDPNHQWRTYARAVEAYTARQLTNPGDILNAFSGIANVIYHGRFIEGLPVSAFDLALLWQPRVLLKRREGFPSWSWAGWIGQVHLETQSLEEFEDEYDSEREQVEQWVKGRTWIVWHSSRGTHSTTPFYLRNGPPCLHGPAPIMATRRFPGQSQNVSPTPSLLSTALNISNKRARGIRYLQFWTISAYYSIELDKSAVLRYSSSEPENMGNGLRRFNLHDRLDQRCGWVLLDKDWIHPFSNKASTLYEFIILSEIQSSSTSDASMPNEIDTGTKIERILSEYNSMMVILKHGILERAGLGRVESTALVNSCKRPMRWKEILLG